MDFSLHQEIPAPIEAVEAALVNADFLARMAELPKLGSAEVLLNERDGDTVKLQVRYLFQADLSPAVTRFVDPKNLTWVEDSTVDVAHHHTTCAIKPDNYANLLSGSYEARIAASATGCVRTVNGMIKVHVPLVGGKAEKAIIGGLSENAEAQATLLTEFIAG